MKTHVWVEHDNASDKDATLARPGVVDVADRAKLFLNRAERRGKWISIRGVDPR